MPPPSVTNSTWSMPSLMAFSVRPSAHQSRLNVPRQARRTHQPCARAEPGSSRPITRGTTGSASHAGAFTSDLGHRRPRKDVQRRTIPAPARCAACPPRAVRPQLSEPLTPRRRTPQQGPPRQGSAHRERMHRHRSCAAAPRRFGSIQVCPGRDPYLERMRLRETGRPRMRECAYPRRTADPGESVRTPGAWPTNC